MESWSPSPVPAPWWRVWFLNRGKRKTEDAEPPVEMCVAPLRATFKSQLGGAGQGTSEEVVDVTRCRATSTSHHAGGIPMRVRGAKRPDRARYCFRRRSLPFPLLVCTSERCGIGSSHQLHLLESLQKGQIPHTAAALPLASQEHKDWRGRAGAAAGAVWSGEVWAGKSGPRLARVRQMSNGDFSPRQPGLLRMEEPRTPQTGGFISGKKKPSPGQCLCVKRATALPCLNKSLMGEITHAHLKCNVIKR